MTNLVITPANVQHALFAGIERGIAGVVITAGVAIYRDTSGQLQRAKTNTAVEADAVGITLNDAAVGQVLAYIVSGDLDLGAVLVVGETYVVSPGIGGFIAPIADITPGQFTTILGIANAINNLKVNIFQGGTAHA